MKNWGNSKNTYWNKLYNGASKPILQDAVRDMEIWETRPTIPLILGRREDVYVSLVTEKKNNNGGVRKK